MSRTVEPARLRAAWIWSVKLARLFEMVRFPECPLTRRPPWPRLHSPNPPRKLVSRKSWVTLALTSLALFAAFLDTTVLFVAFPSIRRSFPSVSDGELSWVLNAYSIVFAALLVPGGRLADQFGRKRLFLIGVAIFTIASMLCGLSGTPAMLIAWRAVQTAGGALLLPSSLALVLNSFPKSKRAIAVTTWGAVGGLAAATGPSLGGAVIQGLGWPWAFYLNLPVGLLAFFIGRKLLEESRDDSSGGLPDIAGIVLSIVGVGLLTFGIIQSKESGWLDRNVIAALLAGSAAVGLFLRQSAKSSAPVLDLSLFRDSNYRFSNAATLTFSIGFNAMYIASVLFLTQVWHYSTSLTGLALTPAPLIVVPFAIMSGRIAAKLGHRPIIVPGGLFFAAAGLWQFTLLSDHPSYLAQWLPATILIGIGVGLSISPLSSAAAHGLSAGRYAIGGAVNSAIRQLGSVLGVALAFALLGPHARNAGAEDFKPVFALMIVCGISTSMFALRLRTKPSPERVDV
jgi:EmrB/QacA subfamily drug resistance transporter